MNCKQVQEMLPAHAARDLNDSRALMIDEHIESCAACAVVAQEYREASQLTQQLTPPVFSQDVYAGIRQRVLRQIENEPAAARFPALTGWLQPRLTWAFAGAVILALAISLLYFVSTRRARPEQLANKSTPVNESSRTSMPQVAHGQTPDSPPDRVQSKPVPRRHPRTHGVASRGSDSPWRMTKAPLPERDAQQATTLARNNSTAAERILRVEMQTRDPNIRIIWFSAPGQ